MTLRHPVLVAAALLVGGLVGCTTGPTRSPVVPSPQATSAIPATNPPPAMPPKPPEEVRATTIRGTEETSALLDNFTAFVRAVDGQAVAAGREGWNKPITLKPGPHRLSVEFVRGSFLAKADLTLKAEPGAAYELRHTSDAQVYGQHSFCEFRIVNLAHPEKAVAFQRVELEKVKP